MTYAGFRDLAELFQEQEKRWSLAEDQLYASVNPRLEIQLSRTAQGWFAFVVAFLPDAAHPVAG
jgi:hypothetical protein